MELIETLWEEIYNDSNMHYIVAEEDNLLLASCVLIIIPNLTRRKGYGSKVLEKALAIAWEHNCYKVMLLTGSKKKERFYFMKMLVSRGE